MYFSSSINSGLPCSWHIRGGPFVHAPNKCKDKFYFYKNILNQWLCYQFTASSIRYIAPFTQLRFYHSKATYSIQQSSLIIGGRNAIQLLNLSANSSSLKGMTKIMTAKTELQKRADRADQSVLFFWPVLIFGKNTRKTVLLCVFLCIFCVFFGANLFGGKIGWC